MQKTLEKIFNGKILPDENMEIKIEEGKEILEEADIDLNGFKEKLTKEQQEDMDYVVSAVNEVSDIRATQSFVDGFKMGATIIMEVLIDDTSEEL